MSMGACKGCGKSILWVTDRETGRAIPLDTTPPVYAVTQDEANNFNSYRANQKFNSDGVMFFVTHFATCPKANDFSRGRRQEAQAVDRVDAPDEKARAANQGDE